MAEADERWTPPASPPPPRRPPARRRPSVGDRPPSTVWTAAMAPSWQTPESDWNGSRWPPFLRWQRSVAFAMGWIFFLSFLIQFLLRWVPNDSFMAHFSILEGNIESHLKLQRWYQINSGHYAVLSPLLLSLNWPLADWEISWNRKSFFFFCGGFM